MWEYLQAHRTESVMACVGLLAFLFIVLPLVIDIFTGGRFLADPSQKTPKPAKKERAFYK